MPKTSSKPVKRKTPGTEAADVATPATATRAAKAGKTGTRTTATKPAKRAMPVKAAKAKKAATPVKATKARKSAKSGTAARVAKAPAARTAKIVVRNSPIHGRGVYAARKIAKGERVMEYRGEIISWKEADRRPPSDPNDPHHTFLFSLEDGKRVIDASVRGNDARWINHSCAPNCETEETEEGRVFVEALRDIARGEELNYDYCLVIDEKITKKLKRQYECRCGAKECRGTMLALKKKKKKK